MKSLRLELAADLGLPSDSFESDSARPIVSDIAKGIIKTLCVRRSKPHGSAEPELGDEPAPAFAKPLTLVLPHCFDPREGVESVVMLGAPHGATTWSQIDKGTSAGELGRKHLTHAIELPRCLSLEIRQGRAHALGE